MGKEKLAKFSAAKKACMGSGHHLSVQGFLSVCNVNRQSAGQTPSGKATPWASQDNPGYPDIGFVDWDNPG